MPHEKRIEIRWRDCRRVPARQQRRLRDVPRGVPRRVGRAALAGVGDIWDYVLARVAIDFRRELTPGRRRRARQLPSRTDRDVQPDAREEIRTLDGELSAEAEAVLVARDRETGRSRPLTDTEREAFERARQRCLSRSGSGRSSSPCRIVSTAHQTTLVEDHLPTDDFVAYHEARARGGAGLIVLEATAPHPSGILTAARARRLPARDRRRLPPRRRRGAAARHAPVRAAPARRPRADLGPAARACAGSVGDPEPALPGGAAGAAGSRDRGDRRRLRGRRPPSPRKAGSTASRSPPRTATWWRSSSTPSSTCETTSGASRRASCSTSCARCARLHRRWRVGVRLSADSVPSQRVAPLLAGEVDYLSLALGDSPSYLGSTLIVPPPPLAREPDRGAARPLPGRPAADRHLAGRRPGRGGSDRRHGRGRRRRHDARPDRRSRICPRKAREGRAREIARCIGCQACIAHYHAGEAIRCAITPAHRPGAIVARQPYARYHAAPARRRRRRARRAGRRSRSNGRRSRGDRARARRAGRRSAGARARWPGRGSDRRRVRSPTTRDARGRRPSPRQRGDRSRPCRARARRASSSPPERGRTRRG